MALKRWIKEPDHSGIVTFDIPHSSLATVEPLVTAPRNDEELLSPIQPGWLVAYRGPDGKLRGGCDDRAHATVQTGERREAAWTFTLTDGTVLPARAIVSVAQVAQNGRIVAAWTVRNFGLDGERQCLPWRVSESDR